MVSRNDVVLDLVGQGIQLRNEDPIRGNRNAKIVKRKRTLNNTQNAGNRIIKYFVTPRGKVNNRLIEVRLLTCDRMVEIETQQTIMSSFTSGFSD